MQRLMSADLAMPRSANTCCLAAHPQRQFLHTQCCQRAPPLSLRKRQTYGARRPGPLASGGQLLDARQGVLTVSRAAVAGPHGQGRP